MAQLNSLLVSGASRFLQKAYFNDGLSVSGDLSVKNITTSGTITATGNVYTNGTITINGKLALDGHGSWLRINETAQFSSGVYFGNTPLVWVPKILQADTFQVGSDSKIKFTTSSANFTVPTTFTNLVQTNNLTVSDTLIATKYQISTIQTLGGAFDVCPDFITSASATATISSSTGSISFGLEPDGKATITVTGYYIITIKDTSITSNSMCGATWTANSKIKINGIINGVSYRSVTGYMQYNLNNTANTINIIVPKANMASTVASGSSLKASNVSIILTHLYKSVNGATARRYPIGMFMTSHNENRGTGISMYDGTGEKPGLVLGNLDMAELDKVGGYAQTGWGLYATNAYLQGTVVASTGKIGGWNLTASSLWSGNSAFKNKNGMYFGSEGISIKDKFYVDKDGALTSTSGTISGFTIDSTYLQYSDKTVGLSASATDWAFWAGGTSTSSAKFRVNHAGKLWASDAEIAGNINAKTGTIGGFTITSNSLWSGNSAYGNASGMYFGASGISIKDKFKVSSAGAMTSTSGTIGGWTITNNSLYRTNSAFKNANGMYFGTSGISIKNKFYVDSAGAMTATSGTIGAMSIKDDGSFEISNSNGTMIFGMNTGTAIQFFKSGTAISGLDYNGSAVLQGQLSVNGLICGGNAIIAGTIDSTGNITSGNNFYFGNNHAIRSYTTDGTAMSLLNFTDSNDLILGTNLYSENLKGSITYIRAGGRIKFGTAATGKHWDPYYTDGDSFSTTWNGAGYITGSGTSLIFSIPLCKPAIIANGASISWTNGGVKVRQNGKYLYGSSATAYIKPSNATVAVRGNHLTINATMPNTTNVTNNDTCGIDATFTISFN